MSGPTQGSEARRTAAGRGQRWAWRALAAAVVVGFVAFVTASARRAAVPVGAGDGPPRMAMPGMRAAGPLRTSLRDVDGNVVRIPAGRAGIAIFVEARNCPSCVSAVRAAGGIARRLRPAPQIVVVSMSAGTSRAEVAALERAAGTPAARYLVDDRNGSLAAMFGAAGVGATAVYDARGRVLARPDSLAEVRRTLVRAAGQRPAGAAARRR